MNRIKLKIVDLVYATAMSVFCLIASIIFGILAIDKPTLQIICASLFLLIVSFTLAILGDRIVRKIHVMLQEGGYHEEDSSDVPEVPDADDANG